MSYLLHHPFSRNKYMATRLFMPKRLLVRLFFPTKAYASQASLALKPNAPLQDHEWHPDYRVHLFHLTAVLQTLSIY